MTKETPQNWVSLVDEKSGLYNRLYLVHFLNEAFARARRYETALSCALFQASWWRDLEEIREIDTLPISELRNLSRFLLLGVREGDILGRWTESEFLLVLPNTPRAGALVCAEKLFARLDELTPPERRSPLSVSLRAGIAGLPEDNPRYAEDLPLLARERLRLAVREGRPIG